MWTVRGCVCVMCLEVGSAARASARRGGELRVEVSRADLASFLVEHFHSSLFTQILCGSASSQPGPSNNTPAITARRALFAVCFRVMHSLARLNSSSALCAVMLYHQQT